MATAIVSGTITQTQSGNPVSGLTIKIYDTHENIKATATTNANGYYSAGVTYTSGDYIYVNIYFETFILLNNSGSSFQITGNITKNYAVNKHYKITGTLKTYNAKTTGTDIQALINARTVKVFQKIFAGESLLGSATSDASGKYIVYFKTSSTSRIDLLVKVVNKTNSAIYDFTSDLYMDPDQLQTVDFLVLGDTYLGEPSVKIAFDKIGSETSASIDFTKLDDNDIKVLMANYDIDEDSAKKYVRANQIMADAEENYHINFPSDFPNITCDVLYGLMKKGISTEPSNMLSVEMKLLKDTLLDSTDSNIIYSGEVTGVTKEEWAENVAVELKKLAVNLSQHVTSGVSDEFTLYDVLKNISDNTKKFSFLEKYVLNDDSDEHFWDTVKDDLSLTTTEVNKTRFNFDLAKFSEFSKKVYDTLYTYSSAGLIESMEALSKNYTNWAGVTSGITDIDDFPDYIEGTTLSEKQTNLANLLKNKIEMKFPSNVVLTHIKHNSTIYDQLNLFVENNTDFELGVRKFVFSNWDGGDLSDPTQCEKDLKALQRLFNILPVIEKTEVLDLLWTNNIRSAHDIVKMGQKSFTELFDSSGIDSDIVESTFANAQKKHSQVLVTFAKYSNKTSATDAYVLPSRTNAGDLESLFTSFDYCDCKDCRSSLSPAAYLTDNLAFMDSVDFGSYTLFDKLKERRPDIEKTLLNCKNTDTPVPYIDLVNEVLEEAVYPYMASDNYPQTDWESDEIDANPEHFNTNAYTKLKSDSSSISPLGLPFNYWNEEAKSFLSHYKLKLSDIIDLFNQTTDINAAMAYLGISYEDKEFLLNAYTYNDTNIADILKDTGLEFDELNNLIRSKYVNPGGISCNIIDCSISDSTLNLPDFKKLFNFKRLLDITNWTLEELDKVIIKIGPTINNDFIIKLSQIKRLQNDLMLPADELLVFWDKINTTSNANQKNDFYKKKYLSNAYKDKNESIFKLDSNGEIDNSLNKNIHDNITEIASVTGLAEKEIRTLTLQDDTLDVLKLSYLNRVSVFSSASGISSEEYTVLSQLSGKSAINDKLGTLTLNPIDTLDFTELLNQVKKSGFSISDLDYLLNENDNDSIFNIDPEEKQDFIEGLQSVLIQIKTDYESGKYDKETLLRDVLKYIEVTENDINDTVKVINGTITGTPASTFISGHPEIFPGGTSIFTVDGSEIEEIEKRFQIVLTGIIQNVYDFIFEQQVLISFVNKFEIDLDFMNEILRTYVTNDSDISAIKVFTDIDFLSESNFGSYVILFDCINKATAFIKNYRIDLNEYIASTSENLSSEIINIFDIPSSGSTVQDIFNKWKNLDTLYNLQLKYFEKAGLSVFDFFTGSYDNLIETAKWNQTDFAYFLNGVSITAEFLKKASKLFEISNLLGVSFETMSAWNDIQNNIISTANEIKSSLKAKYDIETWKSIAKPIMNGLREKRRDALSEYLIINDYTVNSVPHSFNDTYDLYDYFLLDTEMSACGKTSRIVLANSAVQLFMQRVSLNLETGLELTDEQAKEWAWRKKYRVWEANRKIFLYPENWLEPELRDNKTPFFKEMEAELLQVDINTENAETIYKNYLEKLNDVAKLEIAQHYYDSENEELHVIAKTIGKPNIYYYRKRTSYKEWTPWEKIDLEIESKLILPLVFKNTLFLFWVKALPVSSSNTAQFVDVHIMWSEYRNSKWIPGKMSEAVIKNAGSGFPDSNCFFINQYDDTGITLGYGSINVSGWDFDIVDLQGNNLIKFNFYDKSFETVQNSNLLLINNLNSLSEYELDGYKYYIQGTAQLNSFRLPYTGTPDLQWGKWTDDQYKTVTVVSPVNKFHVVLPYQDKFYKSENPFFFEDRNNTFLVLINEPYEKPEISDDEVIDFVPKPIRCQTNAIKNVLNASIPVFESGITYIKKETETSAEEQSQ